MLSQNKNLWLMIGLVSLMALTRIHHFGDGSHLPDASLAVFILAGLFIRSPWFFIALLGEAALLDYVATTQIGVSDWCITPAYVFLIPTYGLLWWTGRIMKNKLQDNFAGLISFTLMSLLAMTGAFIISNASFFAFSGEYADMTWLSYSLDVLKYYPQYLMGGAIYLAALAIVYCVHFSLSNYKANVIK